MSFLPMPPMIPDPDAPDSCAAFDAGVAVARAELQSGFAPEVAMQRLGLLTPECWPLGTRERRDWRRGYVQFLLNREGPGV